jgi:hypothetical protein
MRPFRVWIGEDGGSDRVIFVTRGFQWYLSVKAFGWRLRLFSPFPHVWMGRA